MGLVLPIVDIAGGAAIMGILLYLQAKYHWRWHSTLVLCLLLDVLLAVVLAISSLK